MLFNWDGAYLEHSLHQTFLPSSKYKRVYSFVLIGIGYSLTLQKKNKLIVLDPELGNEQ